MRKILVLSLLSLSCAITPQSIQTVSTVQIDLIRALQQDVMVMVDGYDYELRHWVTLSYEKAMNRVEKDMVDENGMVNLAEYKQAVATVSGQMGEVLSEYDKNKIDIKNAIEAKFAKALILQTLIQEYEKSTGTSPETIAALTTEFGTTITEAYGAWKEAHPDAPSDPNSIKNQFQLMAQGITEKLFEKAQQEIESGAFLDTNPFTGETNNANGN